MAQAIPRSLNWTTKPTAPKGRRFKRHIVSTGGSPGTGFSMGDQIEINVPAGVANQVFDGSTGYLNFTLQATINASGADVAANTQTIAWDYQAGSAIRRLEVYQGGQLLESIDRYGELTNLLYDCQYSQNEIAGLSATLGVDGTDTVSTSVNGNAQTATSTSTLRVGETLSNSAIVTDGNSTTVTREYSIPLLSSIFQLNERYFPAYLLNDDIKVIIILDTQVNAFVIPDVANSSVVCKILNPTIHLDYIELDPSAIQQMNSVFAGGEVVLHTSSYRCYETMLYNATAGTWNAVINLKAMSTKALFTIFRRLGTTGVQEGYMKSSRTNPLTGAGSTFNFLVGGERHPAKPLQTNVANGIGEYFSELQKSFHAWGSTLNNGLLHYACYLSSATVAVGDHPSTRGFAIGLNFTKVLGSNDVILSGTDFSKVTTQIEMNLTTAVTGDQTVDTWSFHDMLLIIDSNGSIMSKY